MLVLSRRKDERIDIGGGIVITVVDIRGDKVRLGIEAPESVSINRREITLKIQAEQHGEETDGAGRVPDAGRMAG